MLRDIFTFLAQRLRNCSANPIDKLFADWRTAAPQRDAIAPYKIEPPTQPLSTGPIETSVADIDRAMRNIDTSRPANTEELWRIYGYGAFRREVTLHLTHFSVNNGGRASALDAKAKQSFGYCTVHDLLDLLARAENEEITSLRNPNYDYISRAIDELIKMEQWTGFGSQKDVAVGDSHWIKDNGDNQLVTATIFPFKPK